MSDTNLGPDGEPEPVGNEAQRKVAELIAATLVKKPDQQLPKVNEATSKQEELNKLFEKATQNQQVKNAEIHGKGQFIPPDSVDQK
jgi:hypothetical protein